MELQIIDPKEYGIEESKALELTTGLNPILEDRNALIEKFNEIKDFEVSTENTSIFKALRIGFQKNRTQGINEWHKSAKEVSLRMGQLLDAVKRNETKTNENYEAFLEEKEKFFENQEKERLSLLKIEREAFLRPFVEVIPNGLEDLDQDVFDSFLETKKKAHLEKLEADRIEAERIEEARLAEIERQRLIEVENAKLKKESEEKEKALEKERAETARIAKIEADKQAKIQAEKDAEIKKEREAKEKLEEQIRTNRKAQLKAETEAKAEADKLSKAPVKKQLSVWVNSFELPTTEVDNEVSKEIIAKFEAFKKWSVTQINNL